MASKEKSRKTGAFLLGAALGVVVGAIAGAMTTPKTELDERDKRVRAGKAALKAKNTTKKKK